MPRAADGDGIKVGQDSTFHPGFALGFGYDSNVFRTSKSEGVDDAAFMLASAWLGIGNRSLRDGVLDSPAERTERKVDYNLAVVGSFRQFLTRDSSVRRQGRFTFGFEGRTAFLPGRKFSVELDESLYRLGDPPNLDAGEGFNFNRLTHNGRLTLVGRPGGGRLALRFGYVSGLLYFERDDITRSDRLVNGAFHETKWRFLPRSSVLVRYVFRHTYHLQCCADVGSGRNEDNFSHRVLGGYKGQLGKKIELEVLAGWGGMYFRDDPNGPDFSGFLGQFQLSYYPTLHTKLGAYASRTIRNSLAGNYIDDVQGGVIAQHEFRWRMLAALNASVTGRRYEGLPAALDSGGLVEDDRIVTYDGVFGDYLSPTRRDTIFQTNLHVEQPLGRFFALAINYFMILDSTKFAVTFTNGRVDEGKYTKHVVTLMGAVRY